MAAPVIYLLKKHWPKTRLTLFGLPSTLALFEQDPHVDARIVLEKKSSTKEQVKLLKEQSFDCGVLLTNSFSSAAIFYRANIPMRIGFKKDMRSWLLTHSEHLPDKNAKEHQIKTYQRLLKVLGIEDRAMPELFLTQDEKMWADHYIKEKIKFDEITLIGINPSAAFGPSKCWPANRFRQVATKLLQDKKNHLIFLGDASTFDNNEQMCNGLERSFNLAGKTGIRQLMALINKCDLFLTNDSGPMHIACALQVPVIALFGSTSPEITGPYNKGLYLRKKVFCSPCFKRECPIDFRCMKSISVNEVYQTTLHQLQQNSLEYATNTP